MEGDAAGPWVTIDDHEISSITTDGIFYAGGKFDNGRISHPSSDVYIRKAPNADKILVAYDPGIHGNFLALEANIDPNDTPAHFEASTGECRKTKNAYYHATLSYLAPTADLDTENLCLQYCVQDTGCKAVEYDDMAEETNADGQ